MAPAVSFSSFTRCFLALLLPETDDEGYIDKHSTQRPRFPTGDSPGLSKALDVVVVLSCEKRALLDVLKMLGASWLAGFALTKLRILNLTSSCTKVAGVNEISILRSLSGKHVILALSLLIAN